MQTDNRFFDDLAKLATGAAGALTSARTEAEGAFRAWLDRRLGELDLVTREEFDAVKEMAAKARQENLQLADKIRILEEKLIASGTPTGKKPAKQPQRKASSRPTEATQKATKSES